jgi:hypothetical protein
MEIEVQSIRSSVRSQYDARLHSAKGDLKKYKRLLAESRTQLARADLFPQTSIQTAASHLQTTHMLLQMTGQGFLQARQS